MRPLIHLGIGPNSIDHQLFVANEALYDQLMERGHQLIEDAKKEFIGHYHNNPPKKTLGELKKECDKLLNKKSQFIDLKAPNIILDDLDNQIVNIYQKIQNKDYGKSSDSVYKKYRESYEQKQDDWFQSEKLETLINEICAYNESEYHKFKLQQDFDPR
jgi:hypothetical protein